MLDMQPHLSIPSAVAISVIFMQHIKRGERSSRGSFNKQHGKQPQLHATGALKKARRESTSDYSQHEFMKTPQGGM